jgi:two-component system nitrogen regulation response regulator NtrX
LFLASVQELPATTQRRLARVLRDGQVRVGGSSRIRSLDLRLVASGPPSLEDDVAEGRFRADLFRRLSAGRIDVPALRERPEDLSEIVRQLQAEGDDHGMPRPCTRAALALLAALPWEGNLDELREVLGKIKDNGAGPIRVEDLLAHLPLVRRTAVAGASLREARRQFEREYVAAVLREHGWCMRDAARALGMQRTNLYRKARQLNIRRMKVSR